MNEVFNRIHLGSFYDREICFNEYKSAGLEENAHSTLIREWKEEDTHPTEIRRQEITSFLLNPGSFGRADYTPADCDQQQSDAE